VQSQLCPNTLQKFFWCQSFWSTVLFWRHGL